MRVTTWNVNSVKQRVDRLLPWLDQRQPDVVCLQETKLSDKAFESALGGQLAERGYEFALYGEAQWNGVALLSRVGLEDVARGLADGPGFPHEEARAVAATCGGVRIHSVYVPNGRVPDSEHYKYKLEWLAALRAVVAAGPADAMVCGDMNIAPSDVDVFDPDAYIGQTHVTGPEREALEALVKDGLHDVVRDRWPDERIFTYWDYRAGMFHQDLGMRIDLVLASAPVAGRVAAAWVDREARKGSKPSDHAPVIVDLDTAPDGDIGPVVPPPSAKPVRRGSVKLPQALSGGCHGRTTCRITALRWTDPRGRGLTFHGGAVFHVDTATVDAHAYRQTHTPLSASAVTSRLEDRGPWQASTARRALISPRDPGGQYPQWSHGSGVPTKVTRVGCRAGSGPRPRARTAP